MQGLRSKNGSDVLIVVIKDQNIPGKLCISGPMEPAQAEEITQLLKSDGKNTKVTQRKDEYDQMYDYVWRDTSLTSGHQMFSLTKSYFPRGKLFVQLLDLLAGMGWGLACAPNFGGVESRDDKGNVTSCVDWPVLVFYKDVESPYNQSHLMFAVKDSNVPGKLCAAGPVGALEADMTSKLGPLMKDVKSEKDKYDEDYDVVWRNTSITTGMQAFSLSKAYFPKGKVNIAALDCAYSAGWRLVAAPNFGGKGDSWPCYIFRQLKDQGSQPAPELLFGSIKDSNHPGKLCFSGRSADEVTSAVVAALQKVPDNGDVKNEKDSYDEDHDAVVRNCKATTGIAAFTLKLPYFPRSDSMTAFLDATSAKGFQIVCCPNFGGMLDSWPTFVFEKRDTPVQPSAFLAVKDDNIPGKLCIGGSTVGADATLAADMLEVLQGLCGEKVEQKADDYDKSYSFAYKNTKLTSGFAMFTRAKPYFPHGYVVEAILQVMYKHGWRAAGGPNFGDNGNTWPGIIFEPISH
jgi:hypothetical protein